ncbi:hypothetical protein [Phaeobacter piscinae]|uniref:hypothetical protein n=1 Tax=Phaeobacter piscinae TaxID=1580596 RepID=UPI00058D5EA2|nr:hypothetical protein [Phaeobacter piscinae]UTS82797.1 hypothetical protein OL67_003907 [Phaeobacter piscinae]
MNNEYHTMSDVDWRWSSQRVKVFGLDPTVLLVFPVLILSGISTLSMVLCAMWVAFLVYIAVRTKHGSVVGFLAESRTRYFQRNKWEVL